MAAIHRTYIPKMEQMERALRTSNSSGVPEKVSPGYKAVCPMTTRLRIPAASKMANMMKYTFRVSCNSALQIFLHMSFSPLLYDCINLLIQ